MQAPVITPSLISSADRVRIVGQGLTGTMLALMLREKGIPFIVQDTLLPGAATPVAPGIVNPLAGRKFRPPNRIGMLLESLEEGMHRVERLLGIDIWRPVPILRMFSEPTQIDRFEKQLAEGSGELRFVDERFPENSFSFLNDVFGSFLTREGGWADLPLLHSTMRAWLAREGCLDESRWDPETDPAANPNEVVCFCDGWRIAENPHWSFIPHNPAKGEMLIVRFEETLPRDRIYNQACWIQPLEGDLWRVGATYTWSGFNSEASLDGADDLRERLQLLTPVPFHVEDQVAGVRPIVEDYRPVIGRHPKIPNWFVLNALGSKGVLQANAAVQALIEHMLAGRGIPPDWCVTRFA
ncbi:MAG TPA: FAD-dependent oxidoreductase [Oceanipulchritudo sp.]|nr:FAD-dependent oxidoreductase [Oceanipulchritudo sp.]